MVEKILPRPSTSSTSFSMPSIPIKPRSAKKISSLYEIDYLKEEDKVQPTDFPTRIDASRLLRYPFWSNLFRTNYHGVGGKPVVIRIALLDSKYLEYQHVYIIAIKATLNSGLVMVTLFPNFTMALADPNFLIAVKV
ncbi:hypothetical protein PVK06_017020 [Gossypium arboreum]|uniref:Uncharacterized protein n=1 Tax=Gossypium arboreum TaxID=29729 RepID=A0ABR0Q1N1_GOSAR|nr:hypothetical protein PVK06_017020 [Gossypium arboreum]